MEKMPLNNTVARVESIDEIIIPENWTILTHGTNLGKKEWTEDKIRQLDDEILIIDRSLSVISEEDKKIAQRQEEYLRSQGIACSGFDTTKSYSHGSGDVLIIKVIFPEIGPRNIKFKAIQDYWKNKFGEETAQSISKLVDSVYLSINHGGRHPGFPGGLRLKKMEDKQEENKREITYIPEQLFDIYKIEKNL